MHVHHLDGSSWDDDDGRRNGGDAVLQSARGTAQGVKSRARRCFSLCGRTLLRRRLNLSESSRLRDVGDTRGRRRVVGRLVSAILCHFGRIRASARFDTFSRRRRRRALVALHLHLVQHLQKLWLSHALQRRNFIPIVVDIHVGTNGTALDGRFENCGSIVSSRCFLLAEEKTEVKLLALHVDLRVKLTRLPEQRDASIQRRPGIVFTRLSLEIGRNLLVHQLTLPSSLLLGVTLLRIRLTRRGFLPSRLVPRKRVARRVIRRPGVVRRPGRRPDLALARTRPRRHRHRRHHRRPYRVFTHRTHRRERRQRGRRRTSASTRTLFLNRSLSASHHHQHLTRLASFPVSRLHRRCTRQYLVLTSRRCLYRRFTRASRRSVSHRTQSINQFHVANTKNESALFRREVVPVPFGIDF